MIRAAIAQRGFLGLVPVMLWWIAPVSAEIPLDQKQDTLALADSLYAATAVDSAQTILAAAIPLARAANDSLYLQDLIVRQGAQMAAFGNVQPAEPILREALALAEARADSATICQVLRWLGFSIANQGRWDEAEAMTRRQIELAAALNLRQMMGWAQVGLGWYAEQRGQNAAAAQEFRAAVEIFHEIADSTGEAWSLNNLGIALFDLGDRDGARTAYLEAAKIARSIDYTMVEAMAANNLGVLEFDGGDPGIAVAQFRRAHELQVALGHTTERIATGLNIGLCLVFLDRLDEAADQLEGIVAEAENLDQPAVGTRALMALASLRHRQGRTVAAKGLLRRVIHEPRDLSYIERTEGMRALAAILAAEDSLSAGLALLEDSALLLADQAQSTQAVRVDQLRGDLLVRDGRGREGLEILLQVEGRARAAGLTGLRVKALAQAAQAFRSLDQPDSSLALLSRAIRVWEAERDLPLDPEWREQRGATGSRVYTDWAAHLLDTEHATENLTEAFGQLQRFKGRTLLERISGPGDAVPEAISDEAAGFISLDRLRQEVLAADELLLDAYLGPETSILFAVTRAETRVLIWPATAELERRLEFFYALHQVPATGDATAAELQVLRSMGRELGDFLLGDIADLVRDCRQLVTVPDGVLNLLPWPSLVVSDPAGGGAVVDLVSRQVASVPSATILANLRAGGGLPPPTRAARTLVFSGGTATGDAALPAARREADWLLRTFANVTRGEAPNAAPAAWRGFDILHFASHARSHDASPWQSEIRLEGAPEHVIRAATVANTELNASLVVLAGCESAGGNILSGEGVQGLTSAFLSAGTPAVLATLWPVDDEATLELMRIFYTELASGQSAAAALKSAQNTLRLDSRTSHPFFWAGFLLVGDGSLTVELAEKPALARQLIFPAAILLLVVIYLIRRRLS